MLASNWSLSSQITATIWLIKSIMPNWFHPIQKCWPIPGTPTGESYTCRTWHHCHTHRLTHSFVQPRLKTSISLAALLLGSITSQSAACRQSSLVDRRHRELCQSEGIGTRGYQGMKAGVGYKDKVTLGAAKGFGVLCIDGGFKNVFFNHHTL